MEESFIREIPVDGSPHRFVCNIKSVNASLGALLHDSIHSVQGYTFLKLHHSISPVQVCLVVDPEEREHCQTMMDGILEDLNKAGHRVTCSDSLEVSHILENNDRDGVPFTVLFSKDSMDTGVVGIRDRDTHFIEPINFKKVAPWLKLNLCFAL